jgi:phosphohistidine phosphatase
MRRLILMRHAKSSWADPGQRDLDRPLTKRGRRAAGLIGGWLKRKDYRPDEALISSARRAQETWAGVVAAAGAAPTSYRPELYHASPEAMLAVLREPRQAKTLLVIAHQPGIGALARRLLDDPPEADPAFDKFPTAAAAVIDFDAADWPDIAWQAGRLADFVVPRALA